MTTKLREKTTELGKSMAALKEGVEAKKVAVYFAYFKARSDELVVIGSELMKEG